MLERVAQKLTDILFSQQNISESDRELYCYQIHKIIGASFSVFITLLLSLLIGGPFPAICFLVFFLSLRGHTGGYHASSYPVCVFTFQVIYVISALSIEYLLLPYAFWTVLAALIFTFVILLLFVPVNHPNVDASREELREQRGFSFLIFGIEIILIFAAFFFNWKRCALYASLGMFATALLVTAAKILKQEVIPNEQTDN